MRLWFGLTALAALLWPGTSQACSLTSDFIPASNFELVQMADAIVIAAALRSERAPDGERQVIFRTRSALKGAPPPEFALPETRLGRTRRSDNEDLSAVNADAYSGMCNRGTFARGGRYLLFLKRGEDGAWQGVDIPFSRINEDYTGEDNSWTRTVRRYLSLQQNRAPMEQIADLTRMAETGRGPDGHPLTQSERDDAAAHLGGISPWKPTAWLLDVYARAERGEPVPFMAAPPPAAEEPADRIPPPREDSAAAALDDVLGAFDEPYQPPSRRRVDPIRDRALESLVQGRHPDALPLFERLWASPETARPLRGLILRYFASNGQYARAYRWIETDLLTELEALPRDDAYLLLRDVIVVQMSDSGEERWRSDAHAAATWPALSRAIHAWQLATFGAGRGYPFFARDFDRQ